MTVKEELQMKVEKLQSMLDEERKSFEEHLTAQISGASDKETKMVQL